MNTGLANTVIVFSLLVAAWCLITGWRNRPAGRGHLVALGIVEVVALAMALTATARMVEGDRPAEFATFIGYLIASVLLLPIGAAVAASERTRWGAVTAGAAALILPVVVVRLNQVWSG